LESQIFPHTHPMDNLARLSAINVTTAFPKWHTKQDLWVVHSLGTLKAATSSFPVIYETLKLLTKSPGKRLFKTVEAKYCAKTPNSTISTSDSTPVIGY